MNDPVQILLVEDNPADVRLTKEAFHESRSTNKLHVINDGAAALDYMIRSGQGDEHSYPDLVLLDLNLPKINGIEFIKRIRANERWKMIPVIMLTTSSSPKDIKACYAEGANCYITKPLGYEAFLETVKQIDEFWLTLARLPHS